ASRFAESREITGVLQEFLPDCDLIVGTEEEIAIAGGDTDTVKALNVIRDLSDAIIVLKRGASGCSIFDSGPVDSLDDGIAVSGAKIDGFKTVGAGDAFLSGCLCWWLNDPSLEYSGTLGSASGALYGSRH